LRGDWVGRGFRIARASAVDRSSMSALCGAGARRARDPAAARPPRGAQRPRARAQIAVGAVKELADQAPEKADRVARATEQAAAQIAPDIEPAAQRATEMTHEAAAKAAKALPEARPPRPRLLLPSGAPGWPAGRAPG